MYYPSSCHVASTSAHEVTRLLSISFALLLALVDLALLRQGIDLHVIGPFPVARHHVRCVARTEESLPSSLSIWSGTRTDEGALSRKKAFFIDALKRSPEIDSRIRTFSCHSSRAISWAVTSEGNWRSTRNQSGIHRHRAVSLCLLMVETRLILQEGLLELLLVLGCPFSRWMFSEPDLLQIVCFFNLRLGIQFFTNFGRNHFLRIESPSVDF